jgi:hypothetical protein
VRGALQLCFHGCDARAAREERAECLVTALRFLGEVADAGGRRRAGDASAVGRVHPGEQLQQRRLAHAVRPDHAEACTRPHGEVDPVEDGEAAPRAGEVTGDEG